MPREYSDEEIQRMALDAIRQLEELGAIPKAPVIASGKDLKSKKSYPPLQAAGRELDEPVRFFV